MQIISSTGFGDSGSSAITDLISEYDGIKSYSSEWEFTFLHATDGLGDLENAIQEGHRLKCDFAIHRFLTLSKKLDQFVGYQTAFKGQFYSLSAEFVKDFCDVQWNGMYEDLLDCFNSEINSKEKFLIKLAETNYKINKTRKFEMYESDSWRPSYVPYTDVFYSCDLDKFYTAAKKYTHKLLELAADGYDKVFLDQLLPPISFSKYQNYFSDEVKLFVVDKDPRDLFLVENLYNGSRFVPFENVETFIRWYKATRIKAFESKNSNNIIFCKLNEIIYEYDDFCKKVESFLKFTSEQHVSKLTKFVPEKSSTNIELYNKYENFSDEISVIERDLKDFLYVTERQKKSDKIEKLHPIKDLLIECNNIQKGIKISNKFKLVFFSTTLISNFAGYKNRTGTVKKIKGLVKVFIGFFTFLPEIIYFYIRSI